MINSLNIQNFKGWKDTKEIELAPITVLLGSNSSGKSSIGHFLMLLKQSVELSDRKSILFTGNDYTAVNLGRPLDMIYNHSVEEPIRYSYKWKLENDFVIEDALHETSYIGDSIEFCAQVSIQDAPIQAMKVNSFNYKLYYENDYVLSIGMKEKDHDINSKRGYDLTPENYDLVHNTGRAWGIPAPVRFYGFPDEAVAYYQNATFLKDFNLVHEKLFSHVYYLGPLRTKADRLYPWSGNTPDSVGFSGEDTIPAILAATNEARMINLKDRGKRRPFLYIIAEMLKEMKLIEDIKIEPIPQRQDYDVKVQIKGSQNWVDIPDVGFGISQVLPVIVQLFYAPSGSTIIIEQPELHLHPSAQARLADVIIAAIHAKEDYKNRNIQLIIETHSEHFLRRLQRRIADETIRNEELKTYFVDNSIVPASLEILQIDIFGNITNWPEDFFGDIPGDIYKQTEAALNRQLEHRE